MCSGLGKQRERGCECVCGGVCVSLFHSPQDQNPPRNRGIWKPPLACCPHSRPTAGSLPPTNGNSSIPLPAQGLGLCHPPSLCGGGGVGEMGVRGRVTLQVSRRVQIFLVSGFITPHCLLRSHSFPVGRAVPVSLKGISRGASGEEPPAPQCKAAASGETSPHQQLSAAQDPSRPGPQPRHSLWDAKPQTGQYISKHTSSHQHLGARGPAVGGARCRVWGRQGSQQPKVRQSHVPGVGTGPLASVGRLAGGTLP